jgi:hypothetical protein
MVEALSTEGYVPSGRSYVAKASNGSQRVNEVRMPKAGLSGISTISADQAMALPVRAMDLKIATGAYAMYLSFEDRARIFDEIDYLLDPDSWADEDNLPATHAYRNFLKWLLESKRLDWSSLGLDADGNLLCAFVGERGVVTAAFHAPPVVHWSSTIETEDGVELSAGQSPLRSFVTTSATLLERI